MLKRFRGILVVLMAMLLMTGCDTVGAKSTSMSVIYGVTVVGALLMLGAYCFFIKKKEIWFILLFSFVLVVNTGYFMLAISTNLEEALFANRIAYLGSVFLPLSMLMMIINVCKIRYREFLPAILVFISSVIFIIAASPGYLDIYYKEVEFCIVNGAGSLSKVYGSWHSIYLFYLIIYFGAMVITIIQASKKELLNSKVYAVILAGAVLVNLIVWLIEQLVSIEFEILSVSYIISEFFLMCFCSMRQEKENIEIVANKNNEHREEQCAVTDYGVEQLETFRQGIANLTPKEKEIYQMYLNSKTTRDVLTELNITENTLKYHNKNIYSKLGVKSRKQLRDIAKNIEE